VITTEKLIQKIRRRETPLARALYRVGKGVLGFTLPVPETLKPAFKALFYAQRSAEELRVWAERVFWAEPLFRARCEAYGVGGTVERVPYITGAPVIRVGDHVRIGGWLGIMASSASSKPTLEIGDETFIGHLSKLTIARSLRIGARCYIAGEAYITDSDGHPLDAERRSRHEPPGEEGIAPVVIEDDVWLGPRTIVLKGVTIGTRTVVGAGSVVTKSLPPDCLAGGIPARVIRKLSPTESRAEAAAASAHATAPPAA
jgi:acetyltransferase-like isoleucine patch superfamily enzyme